MIKGNKISVIITSYAARYDTLDKVIQSWTTQPADEIWIIDSSGKFKTAIEDSRLLIFNMPRDLGTKMDYAFALLTEGDFVCLADDDVIVKPGFMADLYQTWKVTGGIVGIRGRRFSGPNYLDDSKFYNSNQSITPMRVDYCGIIYFAERKLFGFDVRGLPRNCDDLWWQMKVYPKVHKFVAPTDKYEHLKEATGKTSMSHNPALMRQRQVFFRHYYIKNYVHRKKR